ncbi:MAG: hypothetical protein ACT4PV_05965 [Planctomycetaceae bacterium]
MRALSLIPLLSLLFAGCGKSAAEADLDKSEDQLRKEAQQADKATLEKKIAALTALSKELEKEAPRGNDTMDPEKLAKLMEKAFKIAAVLVVYQEELEKKGG